MASACRLGLIATISIWIPFGCSSKPMAIPDARSCPVGDLGAAPELELFHNDPANPMKIASMDSIALEQPPQGGWVFYVEPHARNMDVCGLALTTSLTDTCTHTIVVLETRPVSLEDDGTGWGVPRNIAGDGLVAACPQAMPTRDLDGQPYVLDVVATDRDGRTAKASIEIVPNCSDPFCTCQCSRSYRLGDSCTPGDAGVDGGVDAGSECP
jgi:hypothetical protein